MKNDPIIVAARRIACTATAAGGISVAQAAKYIRGECGNVAVENRRLKAILKPLVAAYHCGGFINCITPNTRNDPGSAKYFKMWDDAKAAIETR